MNILNIAGIAVTAAVLAVLLKQYRTDFAVIVGLAAGVVIFLFVILKAQPAFSELFNLLSKAGVNKQYVQILIKSLGICLVTQLAVDTCKDAGETAIASKVELAGKIAILLIALPLFEQVASLALNLLGN